MVDVARKKDHFQLNQGLNTESNEISFPDGFSVDERNYELLVDGSRKRRKGLAQETGGSSFATGQTLTATSAYASFNWLGVAGDPNKNVIVEQIGYELIFSDDAELPSAAVDTSRVSLASYLVDSDTYASSDVASSVVQFTQGRGVLLVTGKYLKPFYVEYDPDTGLYQGSDISLTVRDYDGIEDGIGNLQHPATLTDDHHYNLRNRGWIENDIEDAVSGLGYFDVNAIYPSKAQVWFKGYRRITDVGYSDLDGIQEFDAAKLELEKFGQSSAPQGGLFLNPLDTRYSASNTNEGVEAIISAMSITTGDIASGSEWTITTATAHDRETGDVVNLHGNIIRVNMFWTTKTKMTLNGFYEITKVDATNFKITVRPIFFGTLHDIPQDGQINGNAALPKSDGRLGTFGPTACAYHAGRAWYAGIEDSEWADTVFFSKIAQKPLAFGICHQEADPTNPEFNALSSSDGGTIVIPNLGSVQRMLPIRDVLLIFSDRGVWEVGGQRGIFTATGYSVRKLSEAECSSSRSPLVVGDTAIYTGPRGIHLIAPNKFTSVLEESSLSEQLVQSLWNAIPTANQRSVFSVYDSALKRVYFLYGDSGDNASHFANALVLDMRVGAYFKYVFNTTSTVGLLGAFAISDSDSSDSNKKIKWATQSTDNLILCDLDHTDYIDFDGSESPLPYFVTGWDNVTDTKRGADGALVATPGEFQARRTAPVITVYAKRTETGYTDTGSGYTGDNESSTLLTAYWDWTDDLISGKIGSQNETYRRPRAFVPASTVDVDGYPVVVSRSKLRGRGRVLQLRFDGAATKDSHILGFTLNYQINRGI